MQPLVRIVRDTAYSKMFNIRLLLILHIKSYVYTIPLMFYTAFCALYTCSCSDTARQDNN